MPDAATVRRISALKPSDLAADVVAAVEALGGEAQRVEIIDRALEIGGWSADELAVVSWYSGAARKYHLRTLADYAVTICRDRGDLTEGTARGRWRLARTGRVERHPYGRVFTAGVGLAGDPVEDDWAADEQTHVWFSQQSLQLGRGDHLFALGAGRASVVLGLFEVTSAGTSRTPPNPWDPARWPWAIGVRALASVPPVEAVAVEGLTAPRGSPHQIEDAGRQAALYAAVEGHVVEGGETADGAPEPRGGAIRRARSFDRDRPPTPARTGIAVIDLEETLALQEKARQGHHALLVHLHDALTSAGWTALEEIPSAIDLRGCAPAGQRVIFEAKTIGADNETAQCRGAVAQLLEYRLEYGRPDDALCVAVDGHVSTRRTEILDRLGIAVLHVGERGLRGINDLGRALMS